VSCSYMRVPLRSHWKEYIEVTSENHTATTDTMEESRAAQISQENFALYGTQKFITILTKTRYSTSCIFIVHFSLEMRSQNYLSFKLHLRVRKVKSALKFLKNVPPTCKVAEESYGGNSAPDAKLTGMGIPSVQGFPRTILVLWM
jgi:hypothetical protein